MKIIWLILGLLLKVILFSVPVQALIPQNPIIINNKQVNRKELAQKQILTIEPSIERISPPNQALIIGRWRGYQETPEYIIYYGYEFRPNGIYVARHRVYQQEKTILDQYWQGQWTFDGKILNLEGSIMNQNSGIFKSSFRLGDDNILFFQDGNLPDPYLPGKMAKVG